VENRPAPDAHSPTRSNPSGGAFYHVRQLLISACPFPPILLRCVWGEHPIEEFLKQAMDGFSFFNLRLRHVGIRELRSGK
jgi:hypothetical protein